MALSKAATEAGARSRRLLHGSLGGLVLKALGLLLGFASQLVLARSLGAEGFGVYVTVIAWATILALLGGFGMPLCSVRFLSVYAERRDWALYRGFLYNAGWLTVGSSLLMGGFVVALFAVVPALQPSWTAMATGAPIILLLSFSALISSAFLAELMPLRADGLGNVSRPILLILLLGGAVWFGLRVTAELAVGLTVVAGIVVLLMQGAAFWQVIAARWSGPRASHERRAWFAAGIAYLVATGSIALLERLDTILVSALISPGEAGPYAIASRLAMLVAVAMAPVSAMVGPLGAQMLTRGDRAGLQQVLSQAVLLSGALAVALSIVLAGFAAPLLALFGSGFAGAEPVLVVLVATQALSALLGPAGGMLAIAGHNRVLVVTMTSTAVLDLVLCLLLIPHWGTLGACLSTAAALLTNAVVSAVAARRLLGVDTTVIGGIIWLVRRRRQAV